MGSKKLIIILIVIVVLAAIGVGVYFGYQKSKQYIGTTPSENGSLPVSQNGSNQSQNQNYIPNNNLNASSSEIAEAQKQNLFTLSLGSIADYWINYSTSSTSTASSSSILLSDVYYLNTKGDIIKIDNIGKESNVTASNFGTPVNLTQNINGSKIVVKFDSGTFKLFDLKSKAWQDIDNDILSVSFSPDGKKLAYLKNGANTQSIYVKDYSKSKVTTTLVSSLSIQDFELNWIDAGKIILVPKQSYDFNGTVWYLDLNKKTLGYFGSGKGYGVVFSSPYNFGVSFTSQAKDKVGLSLIDKSGNNLADIYLSTLVQKCSFAFDQKNLFCAVPYANNSQFTPTLPDDYLKQAINFKDYLYQIDLDSSDINPILSSESFVADISNIKSAKNQVFFVNKYDGKLYMYYLR